MRVTFDDGTDLAVKNLSFEQWRRFMAEFMGRNPNASLAWDVMGCVRGPDSPSESCKMGSAEHNQAYAGRRQRKYNTVEVIREAMFFGVCGGGARHHKGDSVTLAGLEDHFDRHVRAAANALGLKVKVNE